MSKPDYLKYDGRKPEPPYETSPSDAPQRDLHAELSRAWSKTNLGDNDSVQIFLMCFDALWPQIMALRATPPSNDATDPWPDTEADGVVFCGKCGNKR